MCSMLYSWIYLTVISSKLCDEIFHGKKRLFLKFVRKADENPNKTSQIYTPNGQVFNFVRRNQQKTVAETLLWPDSPTDDQGLWLQKGLRWEISPSVMLLCIREDVSTIYEKKNQDKMQ